MREDSRDFLRELYEIGDEAGNCLSLLQGSFSSSSPSQLHECIEKAEALQQRVTAITGEIAGATQGRPEIKEYLSVPPHLQRIIENIGRLAELADKKAKGTILFSDRAVTELNALIQKIREILRSTFDIILVRNSVLGRYVRESEAEIARMADDCATQHEERLIEGLCLPVASSLYLAMLDEVKGIAWHAKEIALRLTE
ncbi:MAG: hypothetical protein WC291_03040 [Thermodesulfovibrionales bacterium]|jgi:Na+/phosphate symporter